jgi:uroporphyrinogen-III decarboxylase
MDRKFYLDLAKSGAAFPIGTDLVVHEKQDPKKVMLDGVLLGKSVEEASRRYHTPLAFPLMDLKLEKALLLDILGIPLDKVDTYHFETCPTDDMIDKVKKELPYRTLPRIQATCDAVRYISEKTDLVPVGMCIGTFSLMTKLMTDPITSVYMLGMGIEPDDEESVATVKKTLELASLVIQRYIGMQLEAGAKAIIMCEPAANKVYISPTQVEEGADIFDRCIMDYAFRIKGLLDKHNADLIFHDCGELMDFMIEKFAKLDPAMLSLGSSRKLWEDARIVPKTTVLYGNLPSKHFYSDEKITKEQVTALSRDLIGKMKEANHPFILGSECDVLSVPESIKTINDKVNAFVGCSCCK